MNYNVTPVWEIMSDKPASWTGYVSSMTPGTTEAQRQISNPFFHPEPSGQQNHIFNPRNMD